KKEFHKNFTVRQTDRLKLDHAYGKIAITYWDKQEVDIFVEAVVESNKEKQAQEILDRIHVRFSQTGSDVSAVTEFNNMNWNGNNQQISITYQVKMPRKMEGNVALRYGDLIMPDANEGKWDMQVKYGNIKAGNFSNPIQIDAKYTNVDIQHVKQAEMDLSYAGQCKVGNADNLILDSKYSTISLGDVKKLELGCKYGSVELETVEEAEISLSYSQGEIDQLKNYLDLESLSYSNLYIREVASSFTGIRAEARYGNLKMRLPKKTVFTVEAEDMKYGDLEMRDFDITRERKGEKEYYRYEINGGGNRSIRFYGNNYSNLKIRTL
ncbi:MAG: hypothetical protein ACI30I_00870, partial [Parabacteroides sp.]